MQHLLLGQVLLSSTNQLCIQETHFRFKSFDRFLQRLTSPEAFLIHEYFKKKCSEITEGKNSNRRKPPSQSIGRALSNIISLTSIAKWPYPSSSVVHVRGKGGFSYIVYWLVQRQNRLLRPAWVPVCRSLLTFFENSDHFLSRMVCFQWVFQICVQS